MSNENLEKKAQAMLKAVHEDKCAEINGREYKIVKINHVKRRKVFAYFTHIQGDLQRRDLHFLDSEEFKKVEEVINSVVTYEDSLLSKLPEHWESFPEDYVLFVQTMLGALSYPFLKGLGGN